MWRRILAAVLLQDKPSDVPEVRERVAEERPIWTAGRVGTAGGALVTGIAVLAGAAVPPSAPVLLLVAFLIVEADARGGRTATSVAAIERRIAWAVVLLGACAAVATLLYGGLAGWIGPLLFIGVVIGCSGRLAARTSIMLSVYLAALFATASTWHYLYIAADANRVEPVRFATQLLSWLFVFAVAGVAGTAVARLRTARAALTTTVTQLRDTLASTRAEADRATRLASEATERQHAVEERNRSLTVVNAVTFALSDSASDDHAFERALRLVARLLEVRFAQAVLLPHAGGAPEYLLAAANPADTEIRAVRVSALMRVIQHGATGHVEDTDEAGASGASGEAPYRVVPLISRGATVGALAVCGAGIASWTHIDQELLLLVARELAAATETRHLFRQAVRRAAQERALNSIVDVLESAAEAREAIPPALHILGEALDADAVAIGGIESLDLPPSTARVSGSDALIVAAERAAIATVAPSDVVLSGDQFDSTVPTELLAAGAVAAIVAPLRGDAGATTLVAVSAHTPAWDNTTRELVARATEALGRRFGSEAIARLQERRIRELNGLQEVGAIVQSTVDANRLLSGFARALSTLVLFRRLYIVRLDEAESIVAVARFQGDGRPEGQSDGKQFAEFSRHAWLTLRSTDTWNARDGLPAFIAPGDRAGIVIPLRPKGQMHGLAVLAFDAPPSNDVRVLAEQACGQLALALDAVSLYRQATDRAARIQVLGNLARIVASVVDLRGAFDAFAEEVRWLIPFETATLMLIDEASDTLERYAMYPEKAAESVSYVEYLPFGTSVFRTVAEAYLPVVLRRDAPSTAQEDWSATDPQAIEIVGVPVYNGDACVAIFALGRAVPAGFDAEDLTALEEVGRLLAISIERVRLFEQAEYRARHDMLTGLPNYRYFQEQCQSLDFELPEDMPMALLWIDMDELKPINDTLGHTAGDEVIRRVGAALRESCRASDFVARVGGDEFAIMMPGATERAALAVGERIHNALDHVQLSTPGAPSRIRLSIGAATMPDDAATIDDLIQAADEAMYEAKFAGGGRTVTAQATSDPRGRVSRTGPRGRIVDALIRAATAGATREEREALALAQRYARALGVACGLRAERFIPLQLLVAASAAARLREPRAGGDRDAVLLVLAGLRTDWLAQDSDARSLDIDALLPQVLDLAWLHAQPPTGSGLPLPDALARIESSLGSDAERELFATLQRAVAQGTGDAGALQGGSA